MNKKVLISLLPITLLVGSLLSCNPSTPTPTPDPGPTPGPTPTPTYPIDFDFNPTSDYTVSVDQGEIKQVKIAFKKSSYKDNVKSITWSIDEESNNYIEKVEEATDQMSFTFKAKNVVTPIDKPAQLKVTIVNKNETTTKSQTCSIHVEDSVNKTLEHDGSWYSYKKNKTITAGTNFKFTTTHDGQHNLTYFGISDYTGYAVNYDISYKDKTSTKPVKITSISLDDGTSTKELEFGDDNTHEAYLYNSYMLVVKRSLFTKGCKLIIDCTITEDITTGIWAYVGSYNY